MLELMVIEADESPLPMGKYRVEFDAMLHRGEDGIGYVADARLVSFTMQEDADTGD